MLAKYILTLTQPVHMPMVLLSYLVLFLVCIIASSKISVDDYYPKFSLDVQDDIFHCHVKISC